MTTSTVDVAIKINPRKLLHRRGRCASGPKRPSPARTPRITRAMALAIKFQDMVDRREVRDYADLARLGYMSRARITQIMNLLNLAPDIQEELLHLKSFGTAAGIRQSSLRDLVSGGRLDRAAEAVGHTQSIVGS